VKKNWGLIFTEGKEEQGSEPEDASSKNKGSRGLGGEDAVILWRGGHRSLLRRGDE